MRTTTFATLWTRPRVPDDSPAASHRAGDRGTRRLTVNSVRATRVRELQVLARIVCSHSPLSLWLIRDANAVDRIRPVQGHEIDLPDLG